MSEDIDGVVSSTSTTTKNAVVIVISGRLPKQEAEKLRTDLQKLIDQYKSLRIMFKPK